MKGRRGEKREEEEGEGIDEEISTQEWKDLVGRETIVISIIFIGNCFALQSHNPYQSLDADIYPFKSC